MNEDENFLNSMKTKLNRLNKCPSYWKQYMIIRGILLEYNRFARTHPYHKCVQNIDSIMFQKCRTILHVTNNRSYTAEQKRYLTKYFLPTIHRTIHAYYERQKQLMCFFALKGMCSDLRRHIIEFLY
jgi:hypothetical protein